MTIEMIDKTGESPSDEDLEEALDTVAKFIVKGPTTGIAPELYVGLANIHRCLKDLHIFRHRLKKLNELSKPLGLSDLNA